MKTTVSEGQKEPPTDHSLRGNAVWCAGCEKTFYGTPFDLAISDGIKCPFCAEVAWAYNKGPNAE